MINKINFSRINFYLLLTFAFFLPISIAFTNILCGIILLLWIIECNFKEKYIEIKGNKVALAAIAIFLINVIGLLWTDDLKWGLFIIRKQWKFLMIPVFLTMVRREHIKYYFYFFISSLVLSSLLFYPLKFGLFSFPRVVQREPPIPFMEHHPYNIFLSFAVYLLVYKMLFDQNLSKLKKMLISFSIISMTLNIFLNIGRTGQVVFFILITLLIFQFFRKKIFKAVLISLIIIPSIFLTAYKSSAIFKHRVDIIFSDIKNYSTIPNTSVALRMRWNIYTLELIKKNPILGVGTGDFPNEYNKIHQLRNLNIEIPQNPHNMYLFFFAQLGLLGLIIFLSIFYFQIKMAIVSTPYIRDLRLVLPAIYIVSMFSDMQLFAHNTSLHFAFFSAIIYKNYPVAEKLIFE